MMLGVMGVEKLIGTYTRGNEGMNIKQFAKLAGVKVVICGAGWGGRYGYKTDDAPNSTNCGYKTAKEARQAWLKDTFGEVAGNAVIKLLND